MEGSDKVSPSPQGQGSPIPSPAVKPRSKARLLLIVVASVVIFLAIALGLGLGLGLDLHHRGGSELSSATPSATPSASAVTYNPPIGNATWRLNTSEYLLDMTTWDLNAPPQDRIYNFTLSEIEAFPDGVVRQMLVINGQFPGPLIRVNRGDRLLINVTNELSQPTTLHWHGLYQNGTNWMDGVSGITQCPIPPGRNFLYNYTVENQFGTFWYHSHTSTQYMDGLVGPFIVHAPEEATCQQMYDTDQVVLIQDWYHNISAELLPGYLAPGNENTEPVPDNGLIQGTAFFNCSSYAINSGYDCYDNSSRALIVVEQNQRHRIRLINTGGYATFSFSVDNHTLSVIEVDATMVDPLEVQRLDIAIAERYSFILTTDQEPTNYWIRAQLNTFCFIAPNPILDPDVRGILSYTNSEAEPNDEQSVDWTEALDTLCQDLNSSLLSPAVPMSAPPADVLYAIDFQFQIGDYALDLAYMNGTSWVVSTEVPTLNTVVPALRAGNETFNVTGVTPSYGIPNQYIVDIPTNQVVDILLTNFDDGSHPFHLHGHVFWVLASSRDQYFPWDSYGSENTTNPVRRDTVVVDAYGWVLIRFVSDNPGMWAFHCHIAWHLEAGLMMQFQARNDLMKDWVLPEDVLGLCTA